MHTITELPMPKYPSYLATSSGNIVSLKWRKRRIMRQQVVRGLLQVTIRDENNVRTSCTVAALIAAAFLGDKRGTVRFLDGNPLNVAVSNLAWNDDIAVASLPEGLTAVPGYDNLYATPDGAIYSRAGKSLDGELRKLAINQTVKGYPRVSFYRNGKSVAQPVHILVARTFLPPPLEGQTMVRHLDGDKYNFHASNLEWGTHQENMEDAKHHYRLHQIRSMRHLGIRALADRFKLSEACILRALDDSAIQHNLIRRNFQWK